jgi:hypothetical protein
MDFKEDFANALNDLSISVDASVIPSEDEVQTGLDSLSQWLSSLEEGTRPVVEEITKVKFGLAEPTVNIAPGLSDLLHACDALEASLSISTILDNCNTALSQIRQR